AGQQIAHLVEVRAVDPAARQQQVGERARRPGALALEVRQLLARQESGPDQLSPERPALARGIDRLPHHDAAFVEAEGHRFAALADDERSGLALLTDQLED